VQRVVVDEDNHAMEVIVADDQLSLAIGRRGQNVKLASRLSSWKIDVRSVSVAEEEAKRARQALEAIPGIEFTHAELLFQAGYRSAREVSETTLEELSEIEGISAEVATEILKQAKELAAKLEEQGEGQDALSGQISDLDKLNLKPEIRDRLIAGSYRTIQSIAVVDDDALLQVAGIGEQELDVIRAAMDTFLKGPMGGLRFGKKQPALPTLPTLGD
jgi:N utilization substance protein A